jgi:hypothetical protein
MLREETISYWSNQIDPLFKKSYKIRDNLIRPTKTFFYGLEGTKRNPILVFKTIPTFTNKSSIIPKGKSNEPKTSKNYRIRIQLVDINSWIRGKTIERYTQEEFDGLLNNIDVKLDCSCYAFHYWGIRYRLSKQQSAIYPTSISDPIRSKQLKVKPTVCKHLLYILKIVFNNSTKILDAIKLKYSKNITN